MRSHGADRVVGVGYHDVLGPAGDVLGDLVKFRKEIILLPELVKIQLGAAEISPHLKDRIAGIGQQDHIAGIAQGQAQMSHALLGTGDGDNLIGGDLHIKTFLIIIFYRLMKFREIPESVMILFRILGRLHQGLTYMVKHGEVRCAHRQIVNLLSAGQKFLFFSFKAAKMPV